MSGPDELEAASYSFREKFLIHFCRFQYLLYIGLVLVAVLFALNTLSFLFGSLDRGTSTVVLVNFLLLGIALSILVGGIAVCNRR